MDQHRAAVPSADPIFEPAAPGSPHAEAIRASRIPMVIGNPRLPHDPVIFANAAFLELTGDASGEMVRRSRRFLQGPGTEPGEAARAARELGTALAAKALLLHEVDQGVKNNLQLISSRISLQARRMKDPAAWETLRGPVERVVAMGAVHSQLYRSSDLSRFDLAAFVEGLAWTPRPQGVGATLSLPLQAVAEAGPKEAGPRNGTGRPVDISRA